MNSNGIITAPVTITDIKTVLLSTSNAESVLCTHNNINKWSKAKPVLVATTSGINFNGNDPTPVGQIWGITVPLNKGSLLVTMAFEILSSNGATTNYPNWPYNKPDGDTYPYRLGDFRNYNHNANPAFTTGITNYSENINLFDNSKINVYLLMDNVNTQFLSDFFERFPEHRLVVELYAPKVNSYWFDLLNLIVKKISSTNLKDYFEDSNSGWYQTLTLDLSKDLTGASSTSSDGLLINKGYTVSDLIGINNVWLIIGILQFSPSTKAVVEGTGTLAPWANSTDDRILPFIFKLALSSYFSRSITIQNIRNATTASWVTPYPDSALKITGNLYVKATITKSENVMYIYNYGQYNSNAFGNKGAILIRAKLTGTSNTDWLYIQLLNSSGQNIPDYITIPTGATTDTAEFYFRVSNLYTSGTYNNLVMEASTDLGSNWVLCGQKSINVVI